jgi:hypothetical protein
MGGSCSNYGGEESCVQGFGGKKKLEGVRPLGKHKRRWEDNITMTLEEVGRRGKD